MAREALPNEETGWDDGRMGREQDQRRPPHSQARERARAERVRRWRGIAPVEGSRSSSSYMHGMCDAPRRDGARHARRDARGPVGEAVAPGRDASPVRRAQALAASARRSRSPGRAIFAALALTTVGAAPTMLAVPHRIAAFAVTLLHAAPVVSHSGVQVFQQGLGTEWTQAMLVCAALLIGAGVAVTRLLPRPTTT